MVSTESIARIADHDNRCRPTGVNCKANLIFYQNTINTRMLELEDVGIDPIVAPTKTKKRHHVVPN